MINILKKNVVGIALHDHFAQLVELGADHGSPALLAYNRVALEGGIIEDGIIKNEELLKAAISELFAKASPGPAKSKNISMILPSRVTFIHIFKFSADLGKKDIKQAIPLQAETIIPFPIADVYWDFSILGSTSNGKEREEQYVLFAAVPKKIADQYLAVFESIRMTPKLFVIHPETLPMALEKQVNENKETLIIDLGGLSANYLVVKDGVTKAFFSSNEGSNSLMQKISANHAVAEADLYQHWEKLKMHKNIAPTIQKFIEAVYVQAEALISEHKASGVLKKVEKVLLTG